MLFRSIFPTHARVMREAVAGLTAREQARATRLLRTLGTRAAAKLSANG